MLERNRIYNMDCVDGMKMLDSGSIDLTVTSPPYDNLRMYKGYSFDFDAVAAELFRVTKDGGVVVWVVNDATIKGNGINLSDAVIKAHRINITAISLKEAISS